MKVSLNKTPVYKGQNTRSHRCLLLGETTIIELRSVKIRDSLSEYPDINLFKPFLHYIPVIVSYSHLLQNKIYFTKIFKLLMCLCEIYVWYCLPSVLCIIIIESKLKLHKKLRATHVWFKITKLQFKYI